MAGTGNNRNHRAVWGSWIIALGEVVNVFAVMARRIGLKKGTGCIVLAIAIGKILGSFLQFFILA